MEMFLVRVCAPAHPFSEEPMMHDVLVALAFIAMVACPAIVAAIPRNEADDDT
jgi:hypothetical protein